VKTPPLLDAFAKLWKATSTFVMSCLSLCIEQLGCHGTDFHEIWYLRIFRKSVEKIQLSLKSDKNNGYVTERTTHLYISLNSCYNAKCFRQSCCENQNTHFTFGNCFLKLCLFFEKMWKNVKESDTPQMPTYGAKIAIFMQEYTHHTHTHTTPHTNKHYLILKAFPRQWWLCERVSVLRYMYISCF